MVDNRRYCNFPCRLASEKADDPGNSRCRETTVAGASPLAKARKKEAEGPLRSREPAFRNVGDAWSSRGGFGRSTYAARVTLHAKHARGAYPHLRGCVTDARTKHAQNISSHSAQLGPLMVRRVKKIFSWCWNSHGPKKCFILVRYINCT